MRLGLAPSLKRGKPGSDYVVNLRARERVVAVVPYQRPVTGGAARRASAQSMSGAIVLQS